MYEYVSIKGCGCGKKKEKPLTSKTKEKEPTLNQTIDSLKETLKSVKK